MENNLIIFLESFEHTGVYIIDKDTMETYYENEVARKYTPRDRIGELCYLVHGNTTMCASCPLRKEDRTSYVIREDLGMVFVMNSTQVKWEDKEAYAIFVRKQRDILVSPVNNDITKRMNRALHSSVLAYCEVNMDSDMCDYFFFSRDSRSAEKASYKEHLEQLIEANVHSEDRNRVRDALNLQHLKELSADGNGPTEITVRYKNREGGPRNIVLESKAYILRDELPHYVSIVTRKVPETELMNSDLIAQVVNNDYDYLILINVEKNTSTAFTNHGLYRPAKIDDAQGYITDYLSTAYDGDNSEEFIHKNTLPYIIEKLEQDGKYVQYYYVKEENQGPRYKKGTYTYLNGDKRFIVFARTDNTEAIKQLESINFKLREALEESAKANEAKSEIFARMSHDLRTPMNAVVGMAALGYEESMDENSKHYFEKINTSGMYLLGLINDILDMNRLENEKIVLHEEAIDVRKFITDIVEMMQPLLNNRNITLKCDFEATDVECISCDIIRTRQIFTNFLSNAIKFSKPGGTVKWVCKDITVENGRVNYTMEFIDYGCGMSQEFIPKIFVPFEQEKNQYSSENPSSGLGLAISKNLIEAMGGSVCVETQLGKGTTFSIKLNHAMAEKKDVRPINNSSEFPELKGKRILIVEDHPLNAEIEEKLLKKQNVEVVLASNGKEAVEIFQSSPPSFFDGILMDVRMPVLNGLEAARLIRAFDREDARSIPIIATTANAFEEDKLATKAAGMNAHLSKPIVPLELYMTLRRLIK